MSKSLSGSACLSMPPSVFVPIDLLRFQEPTKCHIGRFYRIL